MPGAVSPRGKIPVVSHMNLLSGKLHKEGDWKYNDEVKYGELVHLLAHTSLPALQIEKKQNPRRWLKREQQNKSDQTHILLFIVNFSRGLNWKVWKSTRQEEIIFSIIMKLNSEPRQAIAAPTENLLPRINVGYF